MSCCSCVLCCDDVGAPGTPCVDIGHQLDVASRFWKMSFKLKHKEQYTKNVNHIK